MSFPWAHSIVPAVRIFPKDIDELPAIAHCDDEAFTPFENGTFGYGGFEIGKDRRSISEGVEPTGDFQAATRRSKDVGVIELTVVDHESKIDDSSRLRKRRRNLFCEDGDTSNDGLPVVTMSPAGEPLFTQPPHANANQDDLTVAGEAALRCYEHTQALKKQKLHFAKESAHRLLVSVRVGSVSSRSSVLESAESGPAWRPLLCEAVLPTRKNRAASPTSSSFYDVRKRDHLLWTRANPSNAGGFVSTLTGSSVVLNNCKRPREVRVGVKLNGRVVSYNRDTSRSPQSVADVNDFAPVSPSVVAAAVDMTTTTTTCPSACGPSYNACTSMCLLNGEELLKTVVKQAPKRTQKAIPRDSQALRTPPQLECVPMPLNNGAVRVICIAPGTMKKTCVQQVFERACSKNLENCSICWEAAGEVAECHKCGVRAHAACYPGMTLNENNRSYEGVGNGSEREDKLWTCAVCRQGPKTATPSPDGSFTARRRQTTLPARYQSDVLLGRELQYTLETGRDEGPTCTLCPHSGGAMSRAGENGWVHQVCRLWTQTQPESMFSNIPEGPCALCGSASSSKGLIKCAGSGCRVRFHPMCARITLVDDDARNGEIPRGKEKDYRLCGRFTLEVLQCDKRLVPVGFCGFHNPMRERTLYGCYPGGLGTVMRVPPYEIPKP